MKDLIGQLASNAASHKPTASIVSIATVGTGTATALEYIPLLFGAIASVIGVLVGLAILYHTILSIKKIKIELKERTARNGEKERRDD